MPFTKMVLNDKTSLDKEDLDFIYEDLFKPVIYNYEIDGNKYFNSVSRFEQKSGSIIDGIISNINSADLVIADLTGLNPNVMYELGVRHSLKRGTIILSQNIFSIPSDLRDYLCIQYSYSKTTTVQKQNRDRFQVELHSAITELIQTTKVDSPVLGYLGGKSRNWREDQIANLKRNYVVSDYIFETFDKICSLVKSLRALEDDELIEFASGFNVPILYYQVETFENALSDLEISLDSPTLYKNYQKAKMQIAAIRRKIAMQEEMSSLFFKFAPEVANSLRSDRDKILKAEVANYFLLERGQFEQICFEDLFKEESAFYVEFLELLDDFLADCAKKLDVSEDEIDNHLELEED